MHIVLVKKRLCAENLQEEMQVYRVFPEGSRMYIGYRLYEVEMFLISRSLHYKAIELYSLFSLRISRCTEHVLNQIKAYTFDAYDSEVRKVFPSEHGHVRSMLFVKFRCTDHTCCSRMP